MAVERAANKQLEFPISTYFDVHQLSNHIRQKWERADARDGRPGCCPLAERLQSQQLEEECGLSCEKARRRRAQRLEEKLAVAEVKRHSSLAERRKKASHMLRRTFEAAERMSEQQSEKAQARAARLDAKLEQAERVRESQLAAAAAKGGETVARSKAVWAAVRAREEAEALKRRAELESRLQRAGDARHEITETVLASLASRGTEPFLVRRSLTRSILRRQSSSRVLQRCWRAFAANRKTTQALARKFLATGVPTVTSPPWRASDGQTLESTTSPTSTHAALLSGKPDEFTRPPSSGEVPVAVVGVSTTLLNTRVEEDQDPFEQFAKALQSAETLKAAATLLHRLSLKLRPSQRSVGIEGLLKRLFPKTRNPDRYPARVCLCAYMILKHPMVVFSQNGEREEVLREAAKEMIGAFESLLRVLTQASPPRPRSASGDTVKADTGKESGVVVSPSVAKMLAAFDAAWLNYLEQFVAWKLADAASLEAELVRVAVEMEASMLAKLSPGGSMSPRQSPADRQALVEQVRRDHELLRERIVRLGGQPGITRLEAGLAAVRAAAAAATPPATPPPSPGRSPRNSPNRQTTTPVRPLTATSAASPSSPQPAVTNESLAWELLYDLHFQLPVEEAEASWRDATGEADVMKEPVPPVEGLSPRQSAAVTNRRLKRIAEAAFWDSLAGSGPEQAAGLLSELAMQLIEALPPKSRLAAQVEEQINPTRLQEAIASGAPASLLPAFEQLATLLRELGSPARQQPAMAAHMRIWAELQACAGGSAPLSPPLVKALRLLAAQLRLLQVDMSNATLRMLASSLAGGEGIRYAQQKFAARHDVHEGMTVEELAIQLPHTRGWLAQASGQLPALETLSPRSNGSSQGTGSNAPTTMRTGRAAGGSQRPGDLSQKRPATTLVKGINARSWRGLVRVGLVSLATTEQQLNSPPPNLPETLTLDAGRIHEVKERFQQMIVISACLLVTQQVATDRRSAAPDMAALKTRLSAMLGDSALGLASLATELVQSLGVAPTEAAREEAAMSQSLQKMLARGSPGFKALASGLAKVLQQLFLAEEMPASELRASLARYGAASLTSEAQELAEKLGTIAAVTESVHQKLYEKLASGLL